MTQAQLAEYNKKRSEGKSHWDALKYVYRNDYSKEYLSNA